ncbi:MAG: imidazole glycerol phosphate synthase subunit HisH [Treponema sp.]|nr:imidazole glycerol phosphate synthase subunit HisH [Treponema sp.]
MIGIVNYGAGNLGSVMNALKRLGVPARFAAGPEEFVLSKTPFEKIIFPGDGHFATVMESLKHSGYDQALREWISAERPFLGICIGLQLLFEYSEEAGYMADSNSTAGAVKGLGVLKGIVKRFPGRKVPQIGWNQTSHMPDSKLFRGMPENAFFYYIHSYYADPADDSVTAAETEYYVRYCSAVEWGNLAAVQFHPEKSGTAGLKLLENWIQM